MFHTNFQSQLLFANRKTCTDMPDKLLIVSRKKDIRVRQLISKNSLNEHDMVIQMPKIL